LGKTRDVTDRLMPAIAYRLGSVVAFTIMGVFIKLAQARGAGLIEMLFFRQAVALPVVLASVMSGPGLATLRTTRLPAHIVRTILGLMSMGCMFTTVILLPLAESTTMQFTVPIFATILGAIILREATGWHRWAAVIMGFVGVLIVAQPGSGHIPLAGALSGLAAAMFSATVSILLRRLGQSERTTTIVFYFSLLSLVPLTPLFIMSAEAHSATTWLLLVLIGLLGGIGQICMTSSLANAPVAVVVPMDYSGLLWATLFGWLVFDAVPTSMTWVGATIIIGSGLYIVWREHKRAQANAERATAVA
jgi:drug/metabolite transporter (DMT)-like permease